MPRRSRYVTGDGLEDRHRPSCKVEALSLLGMVRVGLLSIEQARELIQVSQADAKNLRKLVGPVRLVIAVRQRAEIGREFERLVRRARPGRKR